MIERIPFEEAIAEPKLFQRQFYGDGSRNFPGLSIPQRAALKIIYGLQLDEAELRAWSIFQGGGTFDHLGYPIKVTPVPYTPKEYANVVVIWGRRSGKTSQVVAFVEAYEAVCGGHLEFVAKKQACALFFTAQKAEFAQDFILQFVLPLVEDSPLAAKRIERANSDGILLSSGLTGVSKKIEIRPAPPNIKSFRGPAIPVIGMDEAAFWYKDAESANPDYEVERAVAKAQQQFPFRKKIVASTPWTKEGIVFDAFNAGTDGKNYLLPEKKARFKGTLVLHAPTPAVANPLIPRSVFEEDYAQDPEAYRRETLAEFVDAVDGIFPEAVLRRAMEGQPSTYGGDEHADREPIRDEKAKEAGFEPIYVAAMDPAFKHDAFTFGVFHHDPKLGVVQDVKRRWKAENRQNPLKPGPILDEIKTILDRYGVVNVLSDQYNHPTLQELAMDRGFSIEEVPFSAGKKATIYGTSLMLARSGKWKLLDDEETFHELLTIQKKLQPGGGMQIGAPINKHDDLATMVVLGTWRAHQMRVEAVATKPKDESRTIGSLVKAHLAHKANLHRDEYDDEPGGYEDDE